MLLGSLVVASFVHNLEPGKILRLKSIVFAVFLVFAIESNKRVDASKALFILTPLQDPGLDKSENCFQFFLWNLFELCVSVNRAED